MIGGGSGTQYGATPEQMNTLVDLWNYVGINEWHHGDCIGFDAQSHDLALIRGYHIGVHPCDDDRKRAFCTGARVEMFEPYPPLVRNKIIVDTVDVMFIVPRLDYEVRRSGTWATWRYAMKVERHLFVIHRDGSYKEDNRG